MPSLAETAKQPTGMAAFWDPQRVREIASPDVSSDELIGIASLMAGGREDEDQVPRDALDALLGSMRANKELTPDGRAAMHFLLIGRLINRVRIQRILRRHPEIHGEQIVRPLIITGVPRSGTTLLQRLLSEDPHSRSLPFWEAIQPVPYGRQTPRESDPRIAHAAEMVAATLSKNPKLRSIHATDPHSPEECSLLLMNSLAYPTFEQYAHVPQYHAWLRERGVGPAYQYYRKQLQILQFTLRRQWWVLKAPRHLVYLDALLAALPDANILQTHRDPLRFVPSLCSLKTTMRGVHAVNVDPLAIGRGFMTTLPASLARATKARDALDTGQFFDVQYVQLVNDPIATVRSIYEKFHYPYTEEFEKRMAAWLAENPQGKHGRHAYSLEQFGLRREEVIERFAPYCQRFGIEAEP